MKLVVVIPAFNEAHAVGAVIEAARNLGEVVLVDDASTDETGDIARSAGAVVVHHAHNKGYDAALASGFDGALALDAEAILTMDADGQHVPEIGQLFLDRLNDGSVDVVVGRRPRRARWSEHVFALYTRRRFGLPDPLCGMKAFRAEVVRRHRDVMDITTIGAGLTVAALADGARFAVVDVPVRERAGRSRFGQGLQANLRILDGLRAVIAIDVRTTRARRQQLVRR